MLWNWGLVAKQALLFEIISQPQAHPLREFSQLRNTSLAHVCHFVAQKPISQLQNGLRNLPKTNFAAQAPPCETTPRHTCAISQPCNLISQPCNPISQLWNPMRNHPLATKSPFCCKMGLLLRKSQPSLKSQIKPLNCYVSFRTGNLTYENPPQVRNWANLKRHLQGNSRGPPSEAKPPAHIRPPFLKFLHVNHS